MASPVRSNYGGHFCGVCGLLSLNLLSNALREAIVAQLCAAWPTRCLCRAHGGTDAQCACARS